MNKILYILLVINTVHAGKFLDFYRKIGEHVKKTRPSTHPVVTQEGEDRGVFLPRDGEFHKYNLGERKQICLDSKNRYFSKVYYYLMKQNMFLTEEEITKINAEMLKKIIQKESKQRLLRMITRKSSRPTIHNVLPTSKDEMNPFKFEKTYLELRKFLADPKRVLRRMKELQREVVLMKEIHSTRDPKQLPLQEVLARWEEKSGFTPAIVLEPKILTGKEWREMLKQGALFYDLVWEYNWYEPHGAETHRIQWHVMLREIHDNPELYQIDPGNIKELYTNMADLAESKKMQWRADLKGGKKTLWYQLVDTEEINFTGPVLTNFLIKNMNGLGKVK